MNAFIRGTITTVKSAVDEFFEPMVVLCKTADAVLSRLFHVLQNMLTP